MYAFLFQHRVSAKPRSNSPEISTSTSVWILSLLPSGWRILRLRDDVERHDSCWVLGEKQVSEMSTYMQKSHQHSMYRTRTFFYAYSCFIATELIGPPLAAWTSDISLWIPIGMGIASLLLCFPVLAIMPESHINHAIPCQDTDSDSERLYYSSTRSHRTSYKMEVGIPWYDSQKPSISALFRQRNMLLALPIFLVGVFRGVSIRLLIQYTSVTFGWKLSQVCGPIPCTI